MATEKRLIDVHAFANCPVFSCGGNPNDPYYAGYCDALDRVIECLEFFPTANAVELPKGRPGDYLEWDNGTGEMNYFRIYTICIDESYIRYDVGFFCPVIYHKNIVRILTPEEMKEVQSGN